MQQWYSWLAPPLTHFSFLSVPLSDQCMTSISQHILIERADILQDYIYWKLLIFFIWTVQCSNTRYCGCIFFTSLDSEWWGHWMIKILLVGYLSYVLQPSSCIKFYLQQTGSCFRYSEFSQGKGCHLPGTLKSQQLCEQLQSKISSYSTDLFGLEIF